MPSRKNQLIRERIAAVYTYLVIPDVFTIGQFPHAETVGDADQCRYLAPLVPGFINHDDERLWCTRLREHDDQHVAHIGPGQPVGAWPATRL